MLPRAAAWQWQKTACVCRHVQPPHLEETAMFARNVGMAAERCLKFGSLQQHHLRCGAEAFEKKEFLPMIDLREIDIACSSGQGDAERQKPGLRRGRQKQWYKDFWLSRLQCSWRSLPRPAVRTVHRSRFHLMWPHSSTSITTGFSKYDYSLGWAFGPILSASLILRGVHG
jgi:hypothetical protein